MNIRRKFRNAVRQEELLNPWSWELYGSDIPTFICLYGVGRGVAQANMLCLIYLNIFKVV